MKPVPTILYVDCRPEVGMERMRLEGMRRYDAGRGWRVETLVLDGEPVSRSKLREVLARLKPVGCAAECWNPHTELLPSSFGRIPVVYFSLPEDSRWRNALRVECDEAAVARMAFRELSAGKPSAYAVVSAWMNRRWARERIDAFRDCCRKAGFECPVAFFPDNDAPRDKVPTQSLVDWAASLPPHCAIFAVNDICACFVADALMRSGRAFPGTVTLVGADGTEPAMPEDKKIAPMVSSVVLDHEMAGYLAAKAIAAPPAGGAAVFPPLLVDRRQSTRGRGRREPHILKAMEMIRREACDGLTAAVLASRFPGSRRLFEMRFREAMGHPPLDEILNVRLDRAMELLAHTTVPISVVAPLCGFRTGCDFWYFFRRRTGMSPLRFRKERR